VHDCEFDRLGRRALYNAYIKQVSEGPILVALARDPTRFPIPKEEVNIFPFKVWTNELIDSMSLGWPLREMDIAINNPKFSSGQYDLRDVDEKYGFLQEMDPDKILELGKRTVITIKSAYGTTEKLRGLYNNPPKWSLKENQGKSNVETSVPGGISRTLPSGVVVTNFTPLVWQGESIINISDDPVGPPPLEAMEIGKPSFPQMGQPENPGGPLVHRGTPSEVRRARLLQRPQAGGSQQRSRSPARDPRQNSRSREQRSKSPKTGNKKSGSNRDRSHSPDRKRPKSEEFGLVLDKDFRAHEQFREKLAELKVFNDSLETPTERVRGRFDQERERWNELKRQHDQNKVTGKKELTPLPPEPVMEVVGLDTSLSRLRDLLKSGLLRAIGTSLEGCTSRDQEVDRGVREVREHTQSQLQSLEADRSRMEVALRNAHTANALLIDENKRLETAVDSLQSYQKVLQADKREVEQTCETLAASHREARAEILVLKKGFLALEPAQATSTPVGEVLGAIGPAESPIPIAPTSTTPVAPIPLTAFQLEINRIRQILDDNGVVIADFERIRAGHWIMFQSGNALIGFVPQTIGPESSHLGEWDDYQSHLILVLRMWRNRWPTSIVGPLPEFIEPLLQTLERKDTSK
jgi:hypothetical protein